MVSENTSACTPLLFPLSSWVHFLNAYILEKRHGTNTKKKQDNGDISEISVKAGVDCKISNSIAYVYSLIMELENDMPM